MTPPQSSPKFFIKLDNYRGVKTEKDFVFAYQNEIIELILKQKAHIESTLTSTQSFIAERSVLRSLPTLVNIDFKEDFGIIGIYE